MASERPARSNEVKSRLGLLTAPIATVIAAALLVVDVTEFASASDDSAQQDAPAITTDVDDPGHDHEGTDGDRLGDDHEGTDGDPPGHDHEDTR